MTKIQNLWFSLFSFLNLGNCHFAVRLEILVQMVINEIAILPSDQIGKVQEIAILPSGNILSQWQLKLKIYNTMRSNISSKWQNLDNCHFRSWQNIFLILPFGQVVQFQQNIVLLNFAPLMRCQNLAKWQFSEFDFFLMGCFISAK